MSPFVVATEKDAGNLAIRKFMEVALAQGVLKVAKTQLLSQVEAAGNFENRLNGRRNLIYNKRK